MRKPVAIVGACLLFITIGWLLGTGQANLFDFLTQLAVALAMTAVGLLYWGFRPEINRFFKERYGAKPELITERVKITPQEEPCLLRVVFDNQNWKDQDIRFFFTVVRNIGEIPAENIQLFLSLPEIRSALVGPLVQIGPSGVPILAVQWGSQIADFQANPHRYARALIFPKTERITSIPSLEPKGIGKTFALFFTVKESNTVYFPVKMDVYLAIPCKFLIHLLLQAKGMPLLYVKSYDVNVQAWNRLQVTELVLDVRLGESSQAS
jgi:hypothetical protein